LDDVPVTLDQLPEQLKQLSPNRPLAINADTKAPFGVIIKVLDVLKQAGIKNIPAFTEKNGS
jgi:biopolymer transport protein ExbD